jgi:DNA topoisomerase-1
MQGEVFTINRDGVALNPDPLAEAKEAAKAAGLRYVRDTGPGIHRRRAGKGFHYVDTEGKPLRGRAEIVRIKGLAIPPAWTEVWICPHPQGHIQATGRDGKGRKQYRYHSRWRAVRDETKYDRMVAFGDALTAIRERTDRDLAQPGLPREKVLATVIRLLEATLIRVGNEEYARANRSFGLTTMRNSHVTVNGSKMRFRFRGKRGILHSIDLTDRRLARIVQRCQDLPGQELFQYVNEAGETQTVGSADVNDYLREITGQDFTAKDFRTWAGTVFAAAALQEFGSFDSNTAAKSNVVRAIETVASRLGNTPAVCRKSYVHPLIIEMYLQEELMGAIKQGSKLRPKNESSRLELDEAAVLSILKRRLKRAGTRSKAA